MNTPTIPTIKIPPKLKGALDIIAIIALLYTIYWLTTPSGAQRMECIIYEPTIKLAQNCSAEYAGGGALVCIPKEQAYFYKQSQRVMQNITVNDYGNFTSTKKK